MEGPGVNPGLFPLKLLCSIEITREPPFHTKQNLFLC